MKTQGSLRRITLETRKKIASYVLENSSKTRDVIATELETILGPDSPSHDTLVKMISKVRNSISPLDSPWHLGLMADYPSIIPEAVRYILFVQGWARGNQHEAVTIRQAIWITRLYSWVELTGTLKQKSDELKWLWHWSRAYAIEEKLSGLAHIKLDTTNMDSALCEGAGIEVFPDYAYGIATKDDRMIRGPGLKAKEIADTKQGGEL